MAAAGCWLRNVAVIPPRQALSLLNLRDTRTQHRAMNDQEKSVTDKNSPLSFFSIHQILIIISRVHCISPDQHFPPPPIPMCDPPRHATRLEAIQPDHRVQ